MNQVLHFLKNDKYSKFWVEDHLKGSWQDPFSFFHFFLPGCISYPTQISENRRS